MFDSSPDESETPESQETESTPPPSDGLPKSRFETVVDLTEAGGDENGKQPIDDVVESTLEDDTLVVVPEGTYTIGTISKHDVSNVGFVAAEGATPTLVPSQPILELPGDEVLVDVQGADILFGGFEFDFRKGAKFGGRVQLIAKGGDVSVYDVTTKGMLPGFVDGYRVEARAKDGVATVENVNMRDGAVEGKSATGIFVGPPHAGEIHIRDCDLWHFPSKGIYASNPGEDVPSAAGGTVHVEGGVYKNNNDCDVRVGSAGSTVRNITSLKQNTTRGQTVTWNRPIPYRHWNDGQKEIIQTRSIRLKGGRNVLIEGCKFYHEIGRGAGVITGEGSHHGETTIRNCRIDVRDVNIFPILLKQGPKPFTIENTVIVGKSGRGAGISVEAGRTGTVTRNCRINLDSGAGIRMAPLNTFTCSGVDITVPGNDIEIGDVGATKGLPYSIRFEGITEQPSEYVLRVTGDLKPRSSGSGASLNVSNVGVQATGMMDAKPLEFDFSGDINELAIGQSVVAAISTRRRGTSGTQGGSGNGGSKNGSG